MRTVYIANDGRAFEDKDECLSYEKDLPVASIKGDYLFINFDGEVMAFNEVKNNFASVQYIFVKTDEAAEILQNILTYEWFTPWDDCGSIAGAWRCREPEDSWWESMEDAQKELDDFKKYAPDWID